MGSILGSYTRVFTAAKHAFFIYGHTIPVLFIYGLEMLQ